MQLHTKSASIAIPFIIQAVQVRLHNAGVQSNETGQGLASSPCPTQILSRSRGEKSGESLGSKLRHDRKWWTRLVRNVDLVS